MKKIIVGVAMILMAGAVSAQKDPVSSVFEKYAGKDGFTTVNISGDMLNMFARAEEERRDTTFTSRLTELRILATEKCDKPVDVNFKSEIYEKIDKSAYKEMLTVKKSEEDVLILMKESDGKIHELLIIVGGKDENVLIQAKGNMLLSEMTQMAGNMQMKGFDHLKGLDK